MENISIAILAGGRSRRMGQDKAMLPWNSGSLLERLAREAAATGHRVRIVGRAQPANWAISEIAFVEDRYPETGPLGGVLTALETTGDSILAVACDMPYLNAAALRWLLESARALPLETPGVATRNGEQIEPLFTIYRQQVRGAITERIAAGRLSLHGLIAGAAFAVIDIPADIRAALVNVNTPEEWRDLDRNKTS